MTCPFCAYPLRTLESDSGRPESRCVAVCSNCYDPAPDCGASRQIKGFGATPEAAMADHREQADDILEGM